MVRQWKQCNWTNTSAFSGLQGPGYTVSVTAQCKVFILVFLFYNATALMLIPLLTLFGLVACLFFYFFIFILVARSLAQWDLFGVLSADV